MTIPVTKCRGLYRAGRLALLLLVTLAAACNNRISQGPTAPQAFTPGLAGERTVTIEASLTTQDGACFEATVLYDDRELSGGRSVCADSRGCSRLELEATTQSPAGRHTIRLLVLEQDPEEVVYRAEARIRLTREGIVLPAPTLVLPPVSVALRVGESATFVVEFSD